MKQIKPEKNNFEHWKTTSW